MRTKERLALELISIGAPFQMVDRARAGHYDDFESELNFPLMSLVNELTRWRETCVMSHDQRQAVGLFIARVKDGEFDATGAEGEEWFKREGGELLDELVSGSKPGKAPETFSPWSDEERHTLGGALTTIPPGSAAVISCPNKTLGNLRWHVFAIPETMKHLTDDEVVQEVAAGLMKYGTGERGYLTTINPDNKVEAAGETTDAAQIDSHSCGGDS